MAQFHGVDVKNFNEAKEVYADKVKRSRTTVNGVNAARVASNTTVRIEGDSLICRLYNTDIFTATPAGFEICTGGYNTPSTRDRLNSIAPVRVRAEKGFLYANEKPFATRIRFDWDLRVVKSDAPDLVKIKSMNKEIDKLINAYLSNPVAPDAGDCMFCSLFGSTRDCMLSHIEEKYAHGSLFYNAAKSAGYSDMRISMLYDGIRKGEKSAQAQVRRVMRQHIRNIVGIIKAPVATNLYVGINN